MSDLALKNSIKVERAKRDMTQGELAMRVGVSRKTINTIETGRFIPTMITALRIARALGVGVEEIFELTEDE